MSAENLMLVYRRAIESEIAEAKISYFRYHNICAELGQKHGYSTRDAAAVFSALSPNSDYIGNLKDAARMLEAHRAGRTIDSFNVQTYGQNKRKAWSILTREIKPEAAFERDTSLKTRNFWHNCWEPEDRNWVTIDGHMYWAWMGRAGGVKGDRTNNTTKLPGAKVTPRIYRAIASDVRALSDALEIIPNQFQAILWVTWKRLHHRKHTSQLEFLATDYAAAGLGHKTEFSHKPPARGKRKPLTK